MRPKKRDCNMQAGKGTLYAQPVKTSVLGY